MQVGIRDDHLLWLERPVHAGARLRHLCGVGVGHGEFAEREHIPFPLLSDSGLRLRDTLQLPTFEVEQMTLYKRLTIIAESGKITKVFYPVFPPDRNATEVLAWLAGGSRSTR